MDIKRSMTFLGKERERERKKKKRVICKPAAAEGSAISQYAKKNQKGLLRLLNEKDLFCTWKLSSGSANFCTHIYY